MLFSFIRHVYLNICFNFNRYNKKKTYWVSIILEIFKWKLSRESQPGVGGRNAPGDDNTGNGHSS